MEVVRAGMDVLRAFGAAASLQIDRTNDGDRLVFYRWDRRVLLSGTVYVSDATVGESAYVEKLELDGPWVYLAHLSRNRWDDVIDDDRDDFDGKRLGSHDWILEVVVSWVLERRDVPPPQP